MKLDKLLDWSQREFHALPWRVNRSLYRTLVSEIMLQQTTVGTVKNHFERFLVRFPDLKSLAQASNDELTVAWKGLGYYRRARNLKKIAETIVDEHLNKFPTDLEILKSIPGVGPYTANALLSIGMNERALAVDANLERVIARLFGLNHEKGIKLQKEIQILFQKKEIFKNKVSFRNLNEALMDLGRTFCQARKASCEFCPLKQDCHAFSKGTPLKWPLEKNIEKGAKEQHELHLLRLIVKKKDKVLVYKKESNEWLSGQFEVPTFVLNSTDKSLKQYPVAPKDFSHQETLSFSSGITKYKIKNSILILSEKDFKQSGFMKKVEWKEFNSEDSNLTVTSLKALKKSGLV